MIDFLRFLVHQAPLVAVMSLVFGSLAVTLFGRKHSGAGVPVTLISLSISLAAAVTTLGNVLTTDGQEIRYRLAGWAPPFGIEYRIDALSALVILVVLVVGLLNALYAKTRVADEIGEKAPYFYTLYMLLIAGLLGIVMTNDAFNLYVLIEITSLTSYALISMGNRRAVLSAFNYVIMGTIGASFYLLGVGYLYIKTGTLNIDDIRTVLAEQELWGEASVTVAFILIMLGVWTKMSFFPLHGWMPNAYTYAPTPVSSLMAPLMTKVMVYVMVRIMLFAFGPGYIYMAEHMWSELIVWMSVIAIVAGSVLALARTDIKKMLTYLIVAEVGYMVGGAWLANETGLTGACYHILADAAMTLCLFLGASMIVIRTGDHSLSAFNGLFKRQPITMSMFTVGALSMVGLPPTAGFFSKWYLISGGVEAGQWGYVSALLFSSLVNAVIFFRIIERAYFGRLQGVEDEDDLPGDQDLRPDYTMEHRVPLSMLVPLICAAALVVLVGVFNHPLTAWIRAALPNL